MTGLPDLNFPAFHAAAALFRGMGVEVVNPAEINPIPQEETAYPTQKDFYLACLRADIKALCDCTAIALLPDWGRSSGAHLELHVAHRLGLEVYTLAELFGKLTAQDCRTGG
jgi:hypothetical protein